MKQNTMIKRWGALLLLTVGLQPSCDKSVLDIRPNFPTEESYFSDESEFTRAVLGTYAKLTDLYWYNGGQNNFVSPIWMLTGDDLTITDNDEFEQFGNIQPASGRLNYYYRALYQMIARANVVLQKISVEDGIYKTPGLKDSHKGEAHFLRGLAYYWLWNTYGTSPLVTERITTTDQLNPPGTTGNQLLDQAISDFTEASALLPASWDEANRGRATRNSAFGMLGKSLVFRGTVSNTASDYTAAITAFNSIQGLSLVSKFDDNFAFDTENNEESLFEFQATQPFAFDNVWLDNDFDNPIGSLSVFWGFFDNNFAMFGKSRFFATDKLRTSFEADDPRLPLTMNPDNGHIRKYVSRNRLTQSAVGSANNARILRYADVLLLKAEALIQSGGSTQEAVGLINQVRKRARDMAVGGTVPADRNVNETNRTVLMEWLMAERMLELAAEGQRWHDLRRWHLGGIITLSNAFFSSSTAANMSFDPSKHLLMPIPTAEIDLNPNVTQNPGY